MITTPHWLIRVLDKLDVNAVERAKTMGGYPAVFAVVDESIVSASLTHDGEPCLSVWRKERFRGWLEAAEKLIASGEDPSDAYEETMPPESES